MTKLEQKLIELGYRVSIFQNRYIKHYKNDNYILVQLSSDKEEIKFNHLYCQSSFDRQEHIDWLQQAFNVMQKDLKELELCQD